MHALITRYESLQFVAKYHCGFVHCHNNKYLLSVHNSCMCNVYVIIWLRFFTFKTDKQAYLISTYVHYHRTINILVNSLVTV